MALDFIDWICVSEMMENKYTQPRFGGVLFSG